MQKACTKGWEGIIAKDAEAPCVHSRSKKWLKFKCEKSQELDIAGYTDPQGSRTGFGALLVGCYQEKWLRYAGKVGTGFFDKVLQDMHEKMRQIEIEESPFYENDIPKKKCTLAET